LTKSSKGVDSGESGVELGGYRPELKPTVGSQGAFGREALETEPGAVTGGTR